MRPGICGGCWSESEPREHQQHAIAVIADVDFPVGPLLHIHRRPQFAVGEDPVADELPCRAAGDALPVYPEAMVITKGDLLDQEARFVRSGLSEYFRCLEVLSTKDPFSYSRILRRHRIRPEVFLMVGNSLRSDI